MKHKPSEAHVTVQGPAEQALDFLVHSHLASLHPDLDFDQIQVEASNHPSAPGNFRVDLQSLVGTRGSPNRSLCKVLAADLSALDFVEKTVVVPPSIYANVALDFLYEHVVSGILSQRQTYGSGNEGADQPLVVSFCSPNANKALHLGHLRSCFLGMAITKLLEARGHPVVRWEFLSNYGIHVCQALVAYRKWGDGATPESAGMKGDHFVGKYYAMFHRENSKLKPELEASADEESPDGMDSTPLGQEAALILQRLEAGDVDLHRLNQTMTEWAAQGIHETYQKIGTYYDLVFRELETLPIAKRLIAHALIRGQCIRRPDGSVFVDLTDRGLGHLTILRRDGTPLVFTQLLGIWVRREQLIPNHGVMHITGDQWKDGVAALMEILRRFGYSTAASVTEPVYFGMIRLPEGKIKSREGLSVGADALLDRVRDRLLRNWVGDGARPADTFQLNVCKLLSLGLLKYFLLKFKRLSDLVYEEKTIWEQALPGFAQLVKTLALAEEVIWDNEAFPSPSKATASKTMNAAQRSLLIHLNAFPKTVVLSLNRRDPSDLVRYLDEVCSKANSCERHRPLDASTWRAIEAVVRRGLALLDIRLPISLRYLPPPFPGRSELDSEPEERLKANMVSH